MLCTKQLDLCIVALPVEPNDLFFVLACDGVWDVMSDQDVVDVAAKALVTDNAREAAAAVVREAYVAPFIL